LGKQWKKNRFWVSHGIVVKPNPIKENENLDMHGFISTEKKDFNKTILEKFIRRGIPCRIHNAYYLKEFKFLE